MASAAAVSPCGHGAREERRGGGRGWRVRVADLCSMCHVDSELSPCGVVVRCAVFAWHALSPLPPPPHCPLERRRSRVVLWCGGQRRRGRLACNWTGDSSATMAPLLSSPHLPPAALAAAPAVRHAATSDPPPRHTTPHTAHHDNTTAQDRRSRSAKCDSRSLIAAHSALRRALATEDVSKFGGAACV